MDVNCQRAKIVGIHQSPSWRTVQYLTTSLEELQYKMSAVWSYQLLFPRLRVRLPKDLIASWCPVQSFTPKRNDQSYLCCSSGGGTTSEPNPL